MNRIPIVLSFNKKYMIPALITIRSIIKHISDLEKVEFFVLHNGLDRYVTLLCEKVVSSWGSDINFLECGGELRALYIPDADLYSSETFNTLLIPTIFSQYEKVFYFDVDLLVRDDILKLNNNFPNDKKLGAARCFYRNYLKYGDYHGFREYSSRVLDIRNPHEYFNSGVILFNNNCITDDDRQNCIKLLEKKWRHHDEGILNHIFQHDVYFFPSSWNMDIAFTEEDAEHFTPAVADDLLNAQGDFSIVHFIARRKPWLEGAPPIDNMYMQEYGRLWKEVSEKIEEFAAATLCGPMWKVMGRINWDGE